MGFDNEKNQIDFAKILFLLIFYTKSNLSMCVYIFSTISKISKIKFYSF